jgi:hypothetical protein
MAAYVTLSAFEKYLGDMVALMPEGELGGQESLSAFKEFLKAEMEMMTESEKMVCGRFM